MVTWPGEPRSLHRLIPDQSVLPRMTPYMEFIFRFPDRRTKLVKSNHRHRHPQQPKSVGPHVSPRVHVRKSPVSQSLTPQWVCRPTHKRTHVSEHRPRPSLSNPPLPPRCAVSLLQSTFLCMVGGWSWAFFFLLLSGGEERGRRRERKTEWRQNVKRAGGRGGAGGRSSAAQGHGVDDLLQLAPQSLSPRLLVPLQGWQDLKIENGRGQWT